MFEKSSGRWSTTWCQAFIQFVQIGRLATRLGKNEHWVLDSLPANRLSEIVVLSHRELRGKRRLFICKCEESSSLSILSRLYTLRELTSFGIFTSHARIFSEELGDPIAHVHRKRWSTIRRVYFTFRHLSVSSIPCPYPTWDIYRHPSPPDEPLEPTRRLPAQTLSMIGASSTSSSLSGSLEPESVPWLSIDQGSRALTSFTSYTRTLTPPNVNKYLGLGRGETFDRTSLPQNVPYLV